MPLLDAALEKKVGVEPLKNRFGFRAFEGTVQAAVGRSASTPRSAGRNQRESEMIGCL